jgi:uncharacterized protein
MSQAWIKLVADHEAHDQASIAGQALDQMVAACLAAAEAGDCDALFDLGVVTSTGSHGIPCDLIEAHKWFNLAAVRGHKEAALCRADISEDMTAREIAEAQRRAREWLRAAKPDTRAA